MKAIGFYVLLNKISDWNKNLFALTFRAYSIHWHIPVGCNL